MSFPKNKVQNATTIGLKLNSSQKYRELAIAAWNNDNTFYTAILPILITLLLPLTYLFPFIIVPFTVLLTRVAYMYYHAGLPRADPLEIPASFTAGQPSSLARNFLQRTLADTLLDFHALEYLLAKDGVQASLAGDYQTLRLLFGAFNSGVTAVFVGMSGSGKRPVPGSYIVDDVDEEILTSLYGVRDEEESVETMVGAFSEDSSESEYDEGDGSDDSEIVSRASSVSSVSPLFGDDCFYDVEVPGKFI